MQPLPIFKKIDRSDPERGELMLQVVSLREAQAVRKQTVSSGSECNDGVLLLLGDRLTFPDGSLRIT